MDERGFSKTHLKFWKVVYPPRMSPFGLKICGHVFSDTIAKILFPGFVWMRWDFSKRGGHGCSAEGTWAGRTM